jgi:hypothetical protein
MNTSSSEKYFNNPRAVSLNTIRLDALSHNMKNSPLKSPTKSPMKSPLKSPVKSPLKSPVKTRVVQNNIRGRPLDRITAEQMSPDNKGFRSIYGGDFVTNTHHTEEERYRSPEAMKSSRVEELHNMNLHSIREEPKLELLSPATQTSISKSQFFTIDGHVIHSPERDPHKAFHEIPYLSGEEAKHFEDMRNLVYKLKYKGPKGSVYQKDYHEHAIEQHGPLVKNDFYATFQNKSEFTAGSTHRNDFKAWSVGPVKKETMNWRPATTGIPFGGRTSYKVDFIDYGCNTAALHKPKQLPTTIPELPMFTKTTYNNDFTKPKDGKKAELQDNNLFGKNILSSNIPFLGESVAMKSFKPFKVVPVPPSSDKKTETYEPSKSYEGSFRSTYRSDFKKHMDAKNPKDFMIPKFSFI